MLLYCAHASAEISITTQVFRIAPDGGVQNIAQPLAFTHRASRHHLPLGQDITSYRPDRAEPAGQNIDPFDATRDGATDVNSASFSGPDSNTASDRDHDSNATQTPEVEDLELERKADVVEYEVFSQPRQLQLVFGDKPEAVINVVYPGDQLRYELTVTNKTDFAIPAGWLLLCDEVPEGTTLIPADLSSAASSRPMQPGSCNLARPPTNLVAEVRAGQPAAAVIGSLTWINTKPLSPGEVIKAFFDVVVTTSPSAVTRR